MDEGTIKTYLTTSIEWDNEHLCALLYELNQWQKRFAEAKHPDLAAVNRWRILASSTNLRDREARARWDHANHWLAHAIGKSVKLRFDHAITLNKILTGKHEGVRKGAVYTCDEAYMPASNLEGAIRAFNLQLKSSWMDPIQRAFEVYRWIITLHPFNDGNGRVARLLADWQLMEQGLLPVCFISPIKSHVGQTVNGRIRNVNQAFTQFLEGLVCSYRIACPF